MELIALAHWLDLVGSLGWDHIHLIPNFQTLWDPHSSNQGQADRGQAPPGQRLVDFRDNLRLVPVLIGAERQVLASA